MKAAIANPDTISDCDTISRTCRPTKEAEKHILDGMLTIAN